MRVEFPALSRNHGLASFKLKWCLCLLAHMSLLQQVWAFSVEVVVVGPCADPLFSKALPEVAVQLAIKRINGDPSLDPGYSFEYVILHEDCQTSRALSSFISYHQMASGFIGPANPGYWEGAWLLGNSWDKGIFSACVNHELDNIKSYLASSWTLPSPIWVLLTVMKYFQWAHAGVIFSDEDILHTGNQVASAPRSHSLPVGVVLTTGQDNQSIQKALQWILQADRIRIIIMCMHSTLIGGETPTHLLEWTNDLKMFYGTYAFVLYDTLLYSLPYKHISYQVLRNNPTYDAVLTISVESQGKTFHEAYTEAVARGEIHDMLESDQVSLLFGTIYNSIYFIAQAMNNAMKENGRASAASPAQHSKNLQFYGFNQLIRRDSSGNGISEYIILDPSWKEELHGTYTMDMEMELLQFRGTPIHFPGGRSPRADAECWFAEGKICGGIDPAFAMMVYITLLIALLSINGCAYFIRHHINKIQLIKGPSRILLTLEDVTFINSHFEHLTYAGSRASVSFQIISEVQSGRSPGLSFSSGSLAPGTYEDSKVAIYEGDWMQVEKFPLGDFRDIKSIGDINCDSSLSLLFLHHENINPLLGFFHDLGMFAIISEFCSQKSLEDILTNEVVKLLLDLIKGMKYLHHSEFVHGLKVLNCVVDGQFVLKVTDYGFNDILEMLRLSEEEPSAEELLTAPELLRALNSSRFTGDVCSFAIIMQEVMIWGTAFCMMELPAEEIIDRLNKPPSVYRPVVSEHAPPECLPFMKQCWAEVAEQPTFDELFNQFNIFNGGKKTNIIDSILRILEQYSSNLEVQECTGDLEIENQKTEKLLTQMLPLSVSESLKKGFTVKPDAFDLVMYLSDIVGFTTISAMSEPIDMVDLLNNLYTLFHMVIGSHDRPLEVFRWWSQSGLPKRNGSRHAAEIANMSLDILSYMDTFEMQSVPEVPVQIQWACTQFFGGRNYILFMFVTLVVDGVTGLTIPRYCLFGDTMNTASQMESTGLSYHIHVSLSIVSILPLSEGYEVEFQGRTELKGKCTEETFWLVGKKGFMKPLLMPPPVCRDGQVGHGLKPSEIAAFQRRKADQLVRNKP
ncbi:LOW QUALITY PROTEIN: retinal guanylyl cyclase 2 [Callospermophilus lateralis]